MSRSFAQGFIVHVGVDLPVERNAHLSIVASEKRTRATYCIENHHHPPYLSDPARSRYQVDPVGRVVRVVMGTELTDLRT